MIEPADVIATACRTLLAGDRDGAMQLLRDEYPHVPADAVERRYGEIDATRVFWRDGFVDRYSGARLVFPGALRALSLMVPDVFPFHPNWKMTATHIAFWELSPTVDHVVPVARGGEDGPANWVTTSMLHNSAKANWTLAELGWALRAPGDLTQWDGMVGWLLSQVEESPHLLENALVRRWYRAATVVRRENAS